MFLFNIFNAMWNATQCNLEEMLKNFEGYYSRLSHAIPNFLRFSNFLKLNPQACPEVVAALRAAGIPMPGS